MDLETFLVRLGRNLQVARHAAGMTLDEASDGRRGAYRYLWELEQGRRNPTIGKLVELAALYGVTVADLVDVPGARPKDVRLSRLKVEGPKRGRKRGSGTR